MRASDERAILGLAEGLAEWFDEHARRKAIPVDLKHQTTFVAESGTDILGFIMLYVADGRLNIGWMGVRRDLQRRGIGTRLLSEAEDFARRNEIDEIATFTLGDRVEYEPYEATRRFYIKNGFTIYERHQTDNAGCPEEIRLKKRIVRPSGRA